MDIAENLIEQDKQHRLLALDPTQSFIVQAPAGSGKTELLIQRFLTLLSCVKSPEEILAITFTKKAANEMRARVLKSLKQALNDPEPNSPHAKKTWLLAKNALQRDAQYQWNLINNPNQLRIQTIDSLCSFLNKQLPLLSHFGSTPDITDNPTILYREAVQEVLMHVEENFAWSQAITRILLHLDNDLNKLQDLLVNLLSKRDQWLPYIQFNSNDDDIRKILEHQLGLVITDTLTTVRHHVPHHLVSELLAITRFAADHKGQYPVDAELTACQHLTQLPGTAADDKLTWIGLGKLLLTKEYTWRKRVDVGIGFPALKNIKNPHEKTLHTEYRQRFTALLTAMHDHENFRLALIEIFHLPHSSYSQEQWEILQSLLQILKVAAAQLRLVFQQHGQIDFIENTQAALSALGTSEQPTDLALVLDYQIKHILIDEFQDTSHTQYQLLEKLTAGWETHDGRTLFVVGDPMQSIYRFREAEVGLFIRMRNQGIHHLTLTPLTLAVNFRSTPTIVEWNNLYFRTIFPPFNNIATGAVSYSPSVSNADPCSMVPYATHSEELGLKNLRNTNNTDKTSIDIVGFVDAVNDTEAAHIIDLIQEIKQKYPEEKIAILVRSRAHLIEIIPALKRANLAYHAIDIDPLASRQPIQDLLSLTCALLHPADRIAWLSILRAPWCGLSLADLLIIAGSDPKAAIYDQLEKQNIRQQLSEEGRQRIDKIFPLLRKKIAVRGRYHLRAWIESTWLLLGGPACLSEYTEIDDVNAFFKLLEEFSTNTQSLSLDKLREIVSQLYASTQHDDENLQIMTIHTAKGLEFDTVILPKLDRKKPNDDKSLLLWMERPLTNDQIALLLAPIHAIGNDKDIIYEYINKQMRTKSDYETDRLLYVAATRAKKRLYLFFNVQSKENDDHRIEPGSFLAKIWQQIEKNKNKILKSIPQEKEADSLNLPPPHRFIQRIHSTWINPIKETATEQVALHRKSAGFELVDHTPKFIGIATHRILQRISHTGTSWWSVRTTQEKIYYLQSRLNQLGISEDKITSSAQLALKSVENMLSDERGRWILKKHREAKSEYAITALIDNKLESLIIDRTFIDEAGTLWIIDYKTAALTHLDLASFLAKEYEKYLEQMQKYYLALKIHHHGSIRLGLYFPALPAWREWEPI
ncbi:MAG: UvrD-helicase domain-containing protein [Gammaproteobacteria bacterium]|nr:UvrD-helicase domain-containing protein [Gammaproteobacteria bacterium]